MRWTSVQNDIAQLADAVVKWKKKPLEQGVTRMELTALGAKLTQQIEDFKAQIEKADGAAVAALQAQIAALTDALKAETGEASPEATSESAPPAKPVGDQPSS